MKREKALEVANLLERIEQLESQVEDLESFLGLNFTDEDVRDLIRTVLIKLEEASLKLERL